MSKISKKERNNEKKRAPPSKRGPLSFIRCAPEYAFRLRQGVRHVDLADLRGEARLLQRFDKLRLA